MENSTSKLINDSIKAAEDAIAFAKEQSERADKLAQSLKNSLDNFSKLLSILEATAKENLILKKRIAELQSELQSEIDYHKFGWK